MPFVKGRSGNPAGRPRGFAGVAGAIRRETNDFEELLAFALRILRDPTSSDEMRRYAHGWLSDRGMGRPVQETVMQLDVNAHAVEDEEPLDLGRLTLEELHTLRALHAKATPGTLALPAGDPEPVDAELVEK